MYFARVKVIFLDDAGHRGELVAIVGMYSYLVGCMWGCSVSNQLSSKVGFKTFEYFNKIVLKV